MAGLEQHRAAALGWASVVSLLYFAFTFDVICPTMMLFVFEAAALAAAEYKIKKDSEFAYRAVEVEPVEPLFGLETPSARLTKWALFFYMAEYASRLVLLYKIISPKTDSIFWMTLALVMVAGFIYVFHAVILRTRTVFHEPRLRKIVVVYVAIIYAALAVALFVGHWNRDQTFRHFKHDHRLKWAAFVHALHGLLVYNNGGRFCAPPDRQPLLSREWALALNLVGWTMLWMCSGHTALLNRGKRWGL